MPNIEEYLAGIDEYLADDDMGARRRSPRRSRRSRGGGGLRRAPLPNAGATPTRQQAAAALTSYAPGIPQGGPRVEPLGFAVFAFTATSGLTLVQTARPQKPFKGSRVVIDIARTGASATGLVSIADLSIGTRPVLVNRAQPIPAGAFAPTAFGIELMMDDAGPGIDITLQLVISAAPTTVDTVVVGATILGLTWS